MWHLRHCVAPNHPNIGNVRPKLQTLPSRIATLDTRSAKPPAKTVDPFLHTPVYQRWRDAVIQRAGGKCEYPGCTRKERRMFADHIVECADDPNRWTDLSNGQCLCGKHHTIKTNKTRAERHAAR